MKITNTSPAILTVGGLDPCGYAGILADARVFERRAIPYRAVLTAITAQSKQDFLSWQPSSQMNFRDQLRCVQANLFGLKIGMLATLKHAKALTDWLRQNQFSWVIWDPVLRSSSGVELLQAKRMTPELWELLSAVDIVTPNIPEAEWMLRRRLRNLAEMEKAAKALHQKMQGEGKPKIVVIKGGHLADPTSEKSSIDLAYDGKDFVYLKAKRRGVERRGTGCHFSAALLAALYEGKNWQAALRSAKKSVLTFLLDAPEF